MRYTIIVDAMDNLENYDIHIINTETNERKISLQNCNFGELVNFILDIHKQKELRKLVTVYHNMDGIPYDKKEKIFN